MIGTPSIHGQVQNVDEFNTSYDDDDDDEMFQSLRSSVHLLEYSIFVNMQVSLARYRSHLIE